MNTIHSQSHREAKHPKPIPLPNELTRGYWEATQQGRLDIQRCQACGYYNHPPNAACVNCLSPDLKYETVSGRGAIYTYTIMHNPDQRGFEDSPPYACIIVELEEQKDLFVLCNLSEGSTTEVKIGRPVEITFERLTDDITLPQCRIAG